MIKRDQRNINKIVQIDCPYSPFDRRIGKIVSFRGDFTKGNPLVNVFVYDKLSANGSIHSFAGHLLEKFE